MKASMHGFTMKTNVLARRLRVAQTHHVTHGMAMQKWLWRCRNDCAAEVEVEVEAGPL